MTLSISRDTRWQVTALANSVLNWVWTHSRSRHSARLVLLSLADSTRRPGAWWSTSVPELMRRTGLKERAVQTATIELAQMGELAVEYNAGPRGCNRYLVICDPAESAPPPQTLRGSEATSSQDRPGDESSQAGALDPADSAPPAESAPPQTLRPTPAESAPVTIKNPKNSLTESSKHTASGPAALFEAEPPVKPVRRTARPAPTRIPDDFSVSNDMRDWALKSVPGYDFAGETENFIDWWKSKGGAAAEKVDWPATWRTWMRRNAKDAAAAHPQARGGASRGNGHQPYRNPADQSVYDLGFNDG